MCREAAAKTLQFFKVALRRKIEAASHDAEPGDGGEAGAGKAQVEETTKGGGNSSENSEAEDSV